MRYIQAAVTDDDHREFTKFAFVNDMTLNELIEKAVKKYIQLKGEEEFAGKEKNGIGEGYSD